MICRAGVENLWRCVITRTAVTQWRQNEGGYASTTSLDSLSNAALFDTLCDQLPGPRPVTLLDRTESQYLGLMLNVCSGALSPEVEVDNGFTGTVGEAIAAIENAINTQTDLSKWEKVADDINNRLGVLAADCPEGDDFFRHLAPCH